MEQSPVFAKCYDLLVWLNTLLTGFPKDQRFRLAMRIEDSAFALHECLLRAVRSPRRQAQLAEADVQLDKLRFYLRLAQDSRCINTRQYEHAAAQCAEIGRLLGGWMKSNQSALPAATAAARGGRR